MVRLSLAISLLAGLSASAVAQERQWSLDTGGDDAFLVFGVPETDDVGVSLWCGLRSGEISIFVPEVDSSLEPGKPITFTLSAGKTVAKLEGKTTANEEAGTTSLEARVSDSQPVFAAMKKADRFKIRAGKEENVYPLIDADVTGLLALCKKI